MRRSFVKAKRTVRGIQRVDMAYAEVASSGTSRNINRDVVLELVRVHQPISRAEVSRLSGLQRSTVSSIAQQLIEERWVCEGAVGKLPRGRRPTMLVLNDDLVVMVVDIHPKRANVAVVNLKGHFLSRSSLPLVPSAALAIEDIVACMDRMKHACPKKRFEGIGVSLPGRVDPITQRLIFAPNLNWPEVDIKKLLERRMGLPVELDNAANAGLLAEMWFGAMDGVRNAVLVTISEGIGTGILANGQLVTGRSGMAGEFGHMLMDPRGPACSCGGSGCWETFASSRAALRYYAEFSSEPKSIVIHELLALASEGDVHATNALMKQARYIGKGLRNIDAALAPELIFLAGDITAAWESLSPFIEAEMDILSAASPRARIAPAYEGDEARLRGAAALVLQRHAGHPVAPSHSPRTKVPNKSVSKR